MTTSIISSSLSPSSLSPSSSLMISSSVSHSLQLLPSVPSPSDISSDSPSSCTILADKKSFPDLDWEERKTCYVSKHPQGSPGWFEAKINEGNKIPRLGSSDAGSSVDEGFTTSDDLALIMSGKKKRIITEEGKVHMSRGNKTEPKSCSWFTEKFKVPLKEIGAAVPKWDKRLVASTDREVDKDICFETKAPKHMYMPLIKHIQQRELGMEFDEFYHEHIWKSHYLQMQMQMKILDKKYCIYQVFCELDNLVYIELVKFNPSYWDLYYLKMRHFLDYKLAPLLT